MILVKRMNDFSQAILTEEYARGICCWRYPGEYSVYNFSDWETVLEKGWDLAPLSCIFSLIRQKKESQIKP